MDKDVLACVIGEQPEPRIYQTPARLGGYRKVRLPHEFYPMLVPDAESWAEGVAIHGLNKHELNRIVFFEGEEYELAPCQIKVGVEPELSCLEALFFDEGIMPPPRSQNWDFEEWRTEHKDYLIRQTTVYMSYYGKMSAAEADVYWQNYSE